MIQSTTLIILVLFASVAVAQDATPSSPDLAWPPITRQQKPWTRWWWPGNAVDAKNLTHELEQFHDAGLGGVEITPIYGIQGADDREG